MNTNQVVYNIEEPKEPLTKILADAHDGRLAELCDNAKPIEVNYFAYKLKSLRNAFDSADRKVNRASHKTIGYVADVSAKVAREAAKPVFESSRKTRKILALSGLLTAGIWLGGCNYERTYENKLIEHNASTQPTTMPYDSNVSQRRN
jgi:hypothetical protein